MHLLDQVSIRVATIHAPELTGSSSAVYDTATLEDLHSDVMSINIQLQNTAPTHLNPARLPRLQHLLNGVLSDETQIFRARLDMPSFRLKLLPRLVQVELLRAEDQSMSLGSFGSEALVLHAESFSVEFDCGRHIFDCEDDMVDRDHREGSHDRYAGCVERFWWEIGQRSSSD